MRLALLPDRDEAPHERLYCQEEGCHQKTNYSKPYCLTHIFLMHYAEKIHDEWEAMQEEAC